MNRFFALLFLSGVALLSVTSVPARADEEGYVKVEIKGTFRMAHPETGPAGVPLEVTAGGQVYELDLKNMPGGPPPQKQLKEFDGQVVILSGRLELRTDTPPRVRVASLALFKKGP